MFPEKDEVDPRQKAQELVDKMFFSIVDRKNERSMKMYWDEAKKCAKIAVGEIKNENKYYDNMGISDSRHWKGAEFWNEVLIEIDKLK